tara:strand:- start:373 stop:978 length:606 start_codon:yes stop_codon:yes gene_type:complete
MPKKCPPGVICIENISLLFIIFLLLVIFFLFYKLSGSHQHNKIVKTTTIQPDFLDTRSSRNDVFNDPYAPPLKSDGLYFRSDSSDIRGHPPPIQVPVNIETRGLNTQYSQVGILTSNDHNNLILPLMGRRHMSGRDKWQYYTISNSGSLNTKLPVSVNGRSCTSEYGCDPIMQNDAVYVEGYKSTFNATVYENSSFHYIPI